MNRLFQIILLILCVSCNTNTKQTNEAIAAIETMAPEVITTKRENTIREEITNLYDIKFELKNLSTEVYELVVAIELKEGSYYVSPNAIGDFTGKFSITINDNDQLERITKLIEKPLSVEEYDPHPFVNGNVNWVRENTSYTQQLQRNSDKDFTASGLIRFTIEPRCTLEQIPFFIKYQDGEMKVEIDRC